MNNAAILTALSVSLGLALTAIACSSSSPAPRLSATAGAGGDSSTDGNATGNGNTVQGVGSTSTGFGGNASTTTTTGGSCKMAGLGCQVFSDCCSGVCEDQICTSPAGTTASSSSGGACSMTCSGVITSQGAESLCPNAPASASNAYDALATCICAPANCAVDCELTCAMEAESNPDCATCEETALQSGCSSEASDCESN